MNPLPKLVEHNSKGDVSDIKLAYKVTSCSNNTKYDVKVSGLLG